MRNSVFAQLGFWAMVLVSVVLPFCIYRVLLVKKAISRITMLLLGLALIAIACLDVYFLQSMAAAAALASSLTDDAGFVSEVSVALYLLPALFGGLGINVISHVLTSHLAAAEKRFASQPPDA